jgi:hypothetical protein
MYWGIRVWGRFQLTAVCAASISSVPLDLNMRIGCAGVKVIWDKGCGSGLARARQKTKGKLVRRDTNFRSSTLIGDGSASLTLPHCDTRSKMAT